MSNHIIHKQQVTVKIPGIDNAFQYQDILSNLFSNGLKTAMQDVLDDADEPGTITRIDKLTLDLGHINAARFTDEFKEKLIHELKQAIQSIHTRPGPNVTALKISTSLRDGFFHFVLNGTLPWYLEMKTMGAFEAGIIAEWDEPDWVYVIDWFRKNIIGHHYIVERLALQFSQPFLILLFKSAFDQKQITEDECTTLFEDVRYVYNEFKVANDRKYLVDLFTILFSKTRYYPVNVLIAEVLLSMAEKYESETSGLKVSHKSLPGYTRPDVYARSAIVATILKNIFFFFEKNIPLKYISPADLLSEAEIEPGRLEKLSGLLPAQHDISAYDAGINKAVIHLKNDTPPIAEKTNAGKIKIQEEGDILFADNCGVILLHPFLPAYFEDLKLVRQKQFISDIEQKKAVLLLHYLSTGSTEIAEFNLVLQKILCGYDSEESLPALMELSQKEIGESATLLQSVINYWPPLKNTSVEGLQNTFLQRKGKLTKTETGWQLTVEQKTVDILLDKLPWGFSTIKLPWMHELLSVDWC